MTTIAIFIPSEYLTPDMSPQKKKVLELANAILENLRTPPAYRYWADGSKLHRYTTANSVHSSVLQLYLMADTPIFKDALTQLEHDKYISISDEVLTLLPKGRLFIVDNGYDYGQNDPLPTDIEYIMQDGIYLPKPKEPVKEIRYKSKMTSKERQTITKFLKANNLVNEPAKFVAFLNGENDGEGLEINNQDQNLTAVTHLLQLLRRKGRIELTATNEFQQYFTSHIRPFSTYTGKEQAEQFKKEVRKATNKKWMECPVARDLEQMIETLILAGVTVFVIYP